MYPETLEPVPDQHLFDEQEYLVLAPATKGQRFANYLIDTIFMELGLQLATTYAFEKLLEYMEPDTYVDLFGDEGPTGIILSAYLLNIINYLLYFTFCEKVFNGMTLGKLITGTKAVRLDGSALTLKDALMRSLSRCVPLEPFSAFGSAPWHDKWTKTMVIKNR